MRGSILYLLPFALFALVLCDCGATQDQLRSRAAFDMECPKERIRLIWIDESTYGVRGCGQKATYVETCTGQKGAMTTTCTWALNTDSRRDRD